MNDPSPPQQDPMAALNEQLTKRFAERLVKYQIKRRSTYTVANAEIFKPYFDKAINTGEDVCIFYRDFIIYAPQTLYRKVADARKFLIDNANTDEERIRYGMLRAQTTLKLSDKIDEGIWISFSGKRYTSRLGKMSTSTKLAVEEAKDRQQIGWQEQFYNWLESGEEGVFNLSGLALTKEEIFKVEEVCRTHLLEYKVNSTLIRVVR